MSCKIWWFCARISFWSTELEFSQRSAVSSRNSSAVFEKKSGEWTFFIIFILAGCLTFVFPLDLYTWGVYGTCAEINECVLQSHKGCAYVCVWERERERKRNVRIFRLTLLCVWFFCSETGQDIQFKFGMSIKIRQIYFKENSQSFLTLEPGRGFFSYFLNFGRYEIRSKLTYDFFTTKRVKIST